MNIIKITLFIVFIAINFSSCKENSKAHDEAISISQSYQEHSPTAHHKTALEVLAASKEWIENFNKGNAEACVAGYDTNAIMSAIPFGVKKGSNEISEFWTPFIESGATNLIYTNVSIEVVDEKTAFLSALWSMNVGSGIIFQEKWEKKNGKWVLTYDNFQVLEQFENPKDNPTNPIASHIVLEEIINASIAWTQGFNRGDAAVCGNDYAVNASMNALPFASIHNQKRIQDFWEKLIKNGAKNLTYHNPTFKATTENSAILSSLWSMNICEGKIYQEKWEKKKGKWVLTYDEFQVLKQY